jgi:hypothetical protein
MRRGRDKHWGQSIAAILAGVGLALVLGYAGIWPQASPGDSGAQVRRSLLVWSGFPANQSPRPLVMSGTRIQAPKGGFPSKSDQQAFFAGWVSPPVSYPSQPPEADGYELIPPADAIALMQTPATGPKLQITKVRLGTGTFMTDRGPRVLPAWLLWFAGVRNPARIAAARIFNPPGLPTAGTTQILSAALGKRVTQLLVTFSAASHRCGKFQITVSESRSAVALVVTLLRGRAHECATTRRLLVVLRQPLAGRVLVDGVTGVPITVTGQQQESSGQVLHHLTTVRHHRPRIYRAGGAFGDGSSGIAIGDRADTAVFL